MENGRESKKTIKRYIVRKLLLAACMLSVLILTACGAKIADEDTIKSDIIGNREVTILDDGESLDEVTIRDRNTDKKSGVDRVICSITSHDYEKTFVKEATVLYKLDDEKNWVLEDITVDSRSNWRIMPVAAPSDDLIKRDLSGQIINADGEEWSITEENLAEVAVKDHNTDLEGFKDTVTVSVKVNDIVEKLSAELILDYVFDDGWKLTGTEKIDKINVEPISGKENNVDEDQLLAIITAEKIKFGDGGSSQKISANKEEISGFEINDTKISDKGTCQEYISTFELQKGLASFVVDSTVEFDYDQDTGWNNRIVEQTIKVSSADVEGMWTGEANNHSRTPDIVTLVLEKDSNGKITGTYKYDERLLDYVGEYAVSGEFNEGTLGLRLDAGDWITKPNRSFGPFEKSEVELLLYAEDGHMEGRGHDNETLTLKRVE